MEISQLIKAASQNDSLYKDPELRQKLKDLIMKGDKGGRPGQWSARKSQLLATQYKAEGGEYADEKHRAPQQKALNQWTAERWTTSDGRPALRDGVMHRYLPAEAWKHLTPAQRKATNLKKFQGKGQFVGNTEAAKRAKKAEEYVVPRESDRNVLTNKTTGLSERLAHGKVKPKNVVEEINNKLLAKGFTPKQTSYLEGVKRQMLFREFALKALQQQRYKFPKGSKGDKSKEWNDLKDANTGIPLIDAATHELIDKDKGIPHNRARLALARHAIRTLNLDPSLIARWYAANLKDYDPVLNTYNIVQAASGITGSEPSFRLSNALSTTKRIDPHGEYIQSMGVEPEIAPNKKVQLMQQISKGNDLWRKRWKGYDRKNDEGISLWPTKDQTKGEYFLSDKALPAKGRFGQFYNHYLKNEKDLLKSSGVVEAINLAGNANAAPSNSFTDSAVNTVSNTADAAELLNNDGPRVLPWAAQAAAKVAPRVGNMLGSTATNPLVSKVAPFVGGLAQKAPLIGLATNGYQTTQLATNPEKVTQDFANENQQHGFVGKAVQGGSNAPAAVATLGNAIAKADDSYQEGRNAESDLQWSQMAANGQRLPAGFTPTVHPKGFTPSVNPATPPQLPFKPVSTPISTFDNRFHTGSGTTFDNGGAIRTPAGIGPTPPKIPMAKTSDFVPSALEMVKEALKIERKQITQTLNKTRNPSAVIVKGNPRWLKNNPLADQFYNKVATYLRNKNYSVSFDKGQPNTAPHRADLWVGHSRGSDRLKFAPKGTQTLDLNEHEHPVARKVAERQEAIRQAYGASDLASLPEHLKLTPPPHHFIFTPQMKEALNRATLKKKF